MIRGTIDQRDLNTWLNWRPHNFPEKKRRWWHYWLGPGFFILPVVVSEVVGFDFHMQTYLITVAFWSFCLALFLLFKFVSRRRRNNLVQPFDFSVDRSGDTVFIQGPDSRVEYPARSLAALRLRENVLIFQNGAAICISPRSQNLEDGKTVEDIANLIQGA